MLYRLRQLHNQFGKNVPPPLARGDELWHNVHSFRKNRIAQEWSRMLQNLS